MPDKTDRIIVRLKEEPEEKDAGGTQAADKGPEVSGEPFEMSWKQQNTAFASKRPMRRWKRSSNRLTAPIIAIVIITVLGSAGVIVYKMGFFGGAEVKKTPAMKPPQPVHTEQVQAKPVQEQKKQEEAAKEKAQPAAAEKPQAAIPAPSPEKTPEKKPAGKSIYSVQIGSFRNDKNAGAFAEQYKMKGYEAFVQTVNLNDKEVFHRVMIGKFEDRKEAEEMARDIRDDENIDAIVMRE